MPLLHQSWKNSVCCSPVPRPEPRQTWIIPKQVRARPFALIWIRIVLAFLTCEPVKLASLATGMTTSAVTHHRAGGRGGYE